ncbi:MAG: hypothetical protein QG597_2709 [Actinomycetota bacterium]|nr:hypothetical protein [Actinomycetota bacterium]
MKRTYRFARDDAIGAQGTKRTHRTWRTLGATPLLAALTGVTSIIVGIAPAGAAVVDDLRAEFAARAPVAPSDVETGGPGENGAYFAWADWLELHGSRSVRGHALAIMRQTKGVVWSKGMPMCDSHSTCRANGKFKSGGSTFHAYLVVNGRRTSEPLRISETFSDDVIWVP